MNSDFILLNKTYQTNDFISKMIVNFPNKAKVMKDYLETNLYKMVENLFAFNINETNRVREKYLKDYIVNLSMINYLMHEAFLKKYISYKQSVKVAKVLIELKKMATTILKGYDNDKV